MDLPSTKLCIFCRRVELISQPCPSLQRALGYQGDYTADQLPPNPVIPTRTNDDDLIEKLQRQPSILCQRCLKYDIMGVFKNAEPLDEIQKGKLDNTEYIAYCRTLSQYEMALGQLSSLLLVPTCPLCRLTFRIMPREGLDPADKMLKIVPVRSYMRVAGWERLSLESKVQTAILLGLKHQALLSPVSISLVPGEPDIRQEQMTGEVIGLSSESTFPGRTMMNARFVRPMIDFSMPKRALDFCLLNHGTLCQAYKPPELLLTRMVDVIDRKTVPCPDHCDYFALSYVWGGVIPAAEALAVGALPQTIEDAITVTKRLGRQYLWVDALCIDQTPNPTLEQAENKERQLNMMDLIYGCASLTLIAIAGQDSDVGLPGVISKYPRIRQVQEIIDGHTLFTVPPTVTAEREVSAWSSRAWTLQEGILSRRYLLFSENQLEYICCGLGLPESFDIDTSIGWPSDRTVELGNIINGAQPHTDTHWFISGFQAILTHYTSRSMSNDEDSLNALLGVLSAWEKRLLPSGFVWGLPLRALPQFLGWMHNKTVVPKRRSSFPSWSWVGWEGEIIIDPMLFEKVSSRWQLTPTGDMVVQFIGINGKELVVEGWEAVLEIRTDPFSEAFVPGTNDLVGTVKERNFLHNNTLDSGTYTCLIIERVKYRIIKDGPEFQRVFMVVLDWVGQVAIRRTMITLTTFAKGDFSSIQPLKRTFTLT